MDICCIEKDGVAGWKRTAHTSYINVDAGNRRGIAGQHVTPL